MWNFVDAVECCVGRFLKIRSTCTVTQFLSFTRTECFAQIYRYPDSVRDIRVASVSPLVYCFLFIYFSPCYDVYASLISIELICVCYCLLIE